jgi:hypothetical protein
MGVPVFGAHMLRICISSWGIVPFINMKWPSLSFLIDFSLKSTLSLYEYSYSCVLMGSICLQNLFSVFDSKPVFIFAVRWVFYKQHMVRSCFLTQFATLFLLIGALSPFIFSVNIERDLFPVILVSLLFSFTYSLFVCLLKRVYSFLSLPVSL